MKKSVLFCLFAPVLYAQQVEPPAAILSTETTVVSEPVATDKLFPLSIKERPFTMPQGSAQAQVWMDMGNFAPDAYTVGAALEVGLTNDLQFGLSYSGVALKNISLDRKMTPSLDYFVFSVPGLAMLATVKVPLYFDGQASRDITLNMHTAIGLGKQFGLSLFNDRFINIKYANGVDADIRLPIRLSWQATKPLWFYVGTSLATLHTNAQESQTFIWKETPVKVGAVFALDRSVDIALEASSANVQDIAKTSVLLGLNYRFGAIDG